MLVLPHSWMGSQTDIFDELFAMTGEVFRHQPGRKTLRIQKDGQYYFIKLHHGVGWREIFKNLFQGRLPVIGAKNEWVALQRLKTLQIPTLELVGYGERGYNPATRHSFVVTKELTQVMSLEAFAKECPDLEFKLKHTLIQSLAHTARTLHIHGINHRDFYLCHFLIKTDVPLEESLKKLYVIDLHRAQSRKLTPMRWLIKDLAGLYFSSLHLKLTTRDMLRFIKYYRQDSLRVILKNQSIFWQQINIKAHRLFKKHTREILLREKNMKIVYAAQFKSLEMEKELKNIEDLFRHRAIKILKAGDTTTVVLVSIGGRLWVVKRYNVMNFWDRLRKTFKRSRAEKCWAAAWKLRSLNIPTPAPLAYIETNKGLFKGPAYFVSEYIEGDHALNYFSSHTNDTQQAKILTRYLGRFEECNISHGDLKATNIIVSPKGLYFIDLDAIRFHKNTICFKHALKKDKKRFLKNWKVNPEVKQLFS